MRRAATLLLACALGACGSSQGEAHSEYGELVECDEELVVEDVDGIRRWEIAYLPVDDLADVEVIICGGFSIDHNNDLTYGGDPTQCGLPSEGTVQQAEDGRVYVWCNFRETDHDGYDAEYGQHETYVRMKG